METLERELTLAQKKAHILFVNHKINYIPLHNVMEVNYKDGLYLVHLRSDGVLMLKDSPVIEYL